MSFKAITFLFISLFAPQLIFSQELPMLDNLLAFTSSDEFIAHNIYNVVGHNFSEDGSIDLLIEGDITSYEYSVAIISMLPAFKQTSRIGTLYLRYTNLNQANLSEAILTEAVASLYPTQVVDYLLTRAECLFEIDGLQVAESMSMESDKLISFIENPKNEQKVKSFFARESKIKERVFVNDIEFDLIPPFYLESEEPSLFQVNLNSCDWVRFDFLAEVLNSSVQRGFKNGLLIKADFKQHELVHSKNDIYVFLIACSATNNPTFITRIDNILHPNNKLDNMVNECGYCNLDKYFNIGFWDRLCKKNVSAYFKNNFENKR